MKRFFQQWLITTLGVLVATSVVPGIRYDGPADVIIASLVLGILNAVLRPVMLFIAFPLLLFTLGLFTLIINACLLYLAGMLVRSFHVEGFGPAFWGALVISVVTLVLNALTGSSGMKAEVRRKPPPRDPGPPGEGPVIDV